MEDCCEDQPRVKQALVVNTKFITSAEFGKKGFVVVSSCVSSGMLMRAH